MCSLSIITPTYNRAYKLSNLYESLCRQTVKEFEWLIVDDGSTDHTESLIDTFSKYAVFPVHYLKQDNGGKHRALNNAINHTNTPWIFVVDSDDFLPEHSVEIILSYISKIDADRVFAGICGYKAFPNGEIVSGSSRLIDAIDANYVEFREKLHIRGDMAEVYRTSVLREYPFPEFDGEKFISEAVVWRRIAEKYQLRYFPKVIYQCEYLPDGLTSSIRRIHRNSPNGTMLYYSEILKDKNFGITSKVRAAINYWRYTINLSWFNRREELKPICWSYVFLPIGFVFYLMDNRKMND